MSPTSLSRRQFLALPAAAGAAALLPGGLLAALARETPALPDLSDWDEGARAVRPRSRPMPISPASSSPAIRRRCATRSRPIAAPSTSNPFLVVEQGLFEDEAHNVPLQVQKTIAAYLGGTAATRSA